MNNERHRITDELNINQRLLSFLLFENVRLTPNERNDDDDSIPTFFLSCTHPHCLASLSIGEGGAEHWDMQREKGREDIENATSIQ